MNGARINSLIKIIPHAKHLFNLCLKLKMGSIDFQKLSLCCARGIESLSKTVFRGKAARTMRMTWSESQGAGQ